jgi:hypothetical protein
LVNKLFAYGPLGIVFCFILLLFWRYGPRAIEAHLLHLSTTSESLKQSIEIQKTNSETMTRFAESTERLAESTEALTELNAQQANTLALLSKATEMHTDPRGGAVYEKHIFSTVQTNRAIELLAKARALETDNPDALKLINEAIEVVRQQK